MAEKRGRGELLRSFPSIEELMKRLENRPSLLFRCHVTVVSRRFQTLCTSSAVSVMLKAT
jgi:hypothetical protein